VQYLLHAAGLNESFLRCGKELPLDDDYADVLKKTGKSSGRIFHNCSGKHAGMLYYCFKKGLSLEDYLSATHPLQQTIINSLSNWTGLSIQDIGVATDGCGAPVHFLPMQKVAQLYANLVTEAKFKPLSESMRLHPYLVSGANRTDYLIARIGKDSLIAKAGADGLMAVTNLLTQEALVLKMRDGLSTMRDHFVLKALEALEWIRPETVSKDTILYNEFDQLNNGLIFNANRQAVGHIVCETQFLH
jgi:L-asparaginase II